MKASGLIYSSTFPYFKLQPAYAFMGTGKPFPRACHVANMAYEFGHSCNRFEAGFDGPDEATFGWYASV